MGNFLQLNGHLIPPIPDMTIYVFMFHVLGSLYSSSTRSTVVVVAMPMMMMMMMMMIITITNNSNINIKKT